jgi:hypothetical protein
MVDEWKKDTSDPFCVVVGVDMNVDTSVFNYIFRDSLEQPATIASKRGAALCLRTPMALKRATPVVGSSDCYSPVPIKIVQEMCRPYVCKRGEPPCRYPATRRNQTF